MGGYKEYKIFDMLKRKSIIIRYIVFIILIFVVTTMFNAQLTKERKIQKDIVYTENSNLDYKVYLKEYNHNTKSKLIINEPIKVDYNKYNDIIKRFV